MSQSKEIEQSYLDLKMEGQLLFVKVLDIFFSFLDHSTGNEEWIAELVRDALLICCFIAQHSLMATHSWKNMVENIGIGVIGRALYIICTSLVLMVSSFA